jgi:hypothetical protein
VPNRRIALVLPPGAGRLAGAWDRPDSHHLIHLQFRRYAGCPICNLHLRSFVER